MFDSNNINRTSLSTTSNPVLSYNLLNIQNTNNSVPIRMKRSYDSVNDENLNLNQSKRCKKSDSDRQLSCYNCELCTSSFANPTNLKQHIETFHMKTSMWACSECKKLFTSKSNLKVHLRVHTRVKPYHCKSCNYSCMHHSSIKEHLAKIHPGVVHSSANPAYAFNSVAVPDPEEFNSANFNREAFIAEAKQANEKLVAEINNKYRINSSTNSSTISTSSPKSNNTSPNLSLNNHNENSLNEFDDQNNSINDPKEKSLNDTGIEIKSNISPKYSSFSISSLINEDKNKQDSSINTLNQIGFNSNNLWTNQIQFFYNYLNQIQQQQQQQQNSLNPFLPYIPNFFSYQN